ncbi:MAG: DNA-binding protein [Halobacteriota archaeon]
MSNSPRDDELERLREERLEQLKAQEGGEQEAREAQREAAEQQRKAILQQYLTDGARKRLNSVKMSRPDHGERVEQQLVALIQSGRVTSQIDEDQMKQLLSELGPDRKKFDIRRR